MKRRLIAFIILCVMTAAIAACDRGSNPGTDPGTEQEAAEGTGENSEVGKEDKKGKKDKKDRDSWSSIADDAEGDAGRKDDDLISYTYWPVSCEYSDNGDTLAQGTFDEIGLSDDAVDKYPALYDLIGTVNLSEYERMSRFLSDSGTEVRQMRSEGMQFFYEDDRQLTPLRSDSRVFSLSVMDYTYLGGAHGLTSYSAVNFDPEEGKEITFSDVVKEPDGLADIVFEALLYDNEDLVKYFEECPSDRDNLLESINESVKAGGDGLTFGLSYKGVIFYFDDYEMGSYAAGARQALVRFGDHPEIFDRRYVYDKKGKNPDIDDIARKVEKADAVMKYEAGEKVELSSGELSKLNIFLSNFAEQRMTYYDVDVTDVDEVSYFSYLWSAINKPSNVKIDGDCYRISFDTVGSLAKKYLGRDISDDDMYGYPWPDENGGFVRNGWYYVPAADGESYALLAIADDVRRIDGDVYSVNFSVYDLDMAEYRDNNDAVPKKYYSMTSSEAASSSDLTVNTTGRALVRRQGSSYILESYSTD